MKIDLSKQIFDAFDRPVKRQMETGELIDSYVADAIYSAATAASGNEKYMSATDRSALYEISRLAAWYPGKKVKGSEGEPVDANPVVSFTLDQIVLIKRRSVEVNNLVVHGFLMSYIDEIWNSMGA